MRRNMGCLSGFGIFLMLSAFLMVEAQIAHAASSLHYVNTADALTAGGGASNTVSFHESLGVLGQEMEYPNASSANYVEHGGFVVTCAFSVGGGGAEGEGILEGTEEGITEGEEVAEGQAEGMIEGEEEGLVEGEGIQEGEGIAEGEGEEEGMPSEGSPEEGAGEGEGEPHSADQNGDWRIGLSELLRVIQFFNSQGYHCAGSPGDTEDGFVPGPGTNYTCTPHDSDYNTQDWRVGLSELLRVIQFFNSGGYHGCTGSEDGFCPGPGR